MSASPIRRSICTHPSSCSHRRGTDSPPTPASGTGGCHERPRQTLPATARAGILH
jgi:hypothetical protein